MKRLLIVKLGSTYPLLSQSHGDFEDWIRARLEVPQERVEVIDGRRQRLLDPGSWAGVMVTGSQSMVTEHKPWSERLARWMAEAVAQQVPLLGICYGHQLLAYALGGEIGTNPAGREIGTVEITLQPAAGRDPLFAETPQRLFGHVYHGQTVRRLPPGATCLATSRREACHAFVLGNRAWGVQFHPEFDAHVARTYVRQSADLLRAEGQCPEHLLDEVRETPEATALLSRFARLAEGAIA